MNVVVFIKSLFKGVLYAFIIGMMVWVVLFVVAILFDSKSLEQLIYGWYRFFVLCIICYPLGVLASYHIEKEETTCPRCKKPTRVAHKFYEDGSKGRVCAKCGEAL